MAHSRNLVEALELRPRAPCGHPAPCGCEWAECCFKCPLPMCKFDAHGATEAVLRQLPEHKQLLARRRLKAWELKEDGWQHSQIATALGVTVRTISNDLRIVRGNGNGQQK